MVESSYTQHGASPFVPVDDKAIAAFFSNLLGREVHVSDSAQQDLAADGTVIAAYSQRGDRADALCVLDICAAASLAVAGSIVEAGKFEAALRRKSLDSVLRQRLHALCEFGGSLFSSSSAQANGERLMLIDTMEIAEAWQEVRTMLEHSSESRSFQITILDGYNGQLTLLTR